MSARALPVCLIASLIAWPGWAQQFDNFDEDNPFEGFQLETEGDVELDPGLTLSEDGALAPGEETGEIQLNLGIRPQGTFETFPGVTGPVTSITQPPTSQGSVVALRALDKMLGQPTDVELGIGQTVVFGRIAIRAIECRYPTTDPDADAYAHLEVLDLQGQPIYDGWMIASSPALSALEHARYDVWVLQCRGA